MIEKPWEKINMTREDFVKLSWLEKRKVLIGLGFKPLPKYKQWLRDLSLWWNRPPGGYLLNAYFKENAERVHLGIGWEE